MTDQDKNSGNAAPSAEVAVPEKLQSTSVVVITESQQGNQVIKTVSKVRQFPEELITALPEGIGENK